MFVEVLQRSNKQDLSCARNDLTAISVCLENMGEQWAIKLAMKGEKMHEICWLASKATVNNYCSGRAASMIYTYAGIQWCHVEVVFLLDFLEMTLDLKIQFLLKTAKCFTSKLSWSIFKGST